MEKGIITEVVEKAPAATQDGAAYLYGAASGQLIMGYVPEFAAPLLSAASRDAAQKLISQLVPIVDEATVSATIDRFTALGLLR